MGGELRGARTIYLGGDPVRISSHLGYQPFGAQADEEIPSVLDHSASPYGAAAGSSAMESGWICCFRRRNPLVPGRSAHSPRFRPPSPAVVTDLLDADGAFGAYRALLDRGRDISVCPRYVLRFQHRWGLDRGLLP